MHCINTPTPMDFAPQPLIAHRFSPGIPAFEGFCYRGWERERDGKRWLWTWLRHGSLASLAARLTSLSRKSLFSKHSPSSFLPLPSHLEPNLPKTTSPGPPCRIFWTMSCWVVFPVPEMPMKRWRWLRRGRREVVALWILRIVVPLYPPPLIRTMSNWLCRFSTPCVRPSIKVPSIFEIDSCCQRPRRCCYRHSFKFVMNFGLWTVLCNESVMMNHSSMFHVHAIMPIWRSN